MTTWNQSRSSTPFNVAPPLQDFRRPYPLVDEVRRLGDPPARSAREAFVRLWLTEGIPFAFKTCPAVYEEMRSWLASQLGTHSKDVTLIGSARLGYSLGSSKVLGRPFGSKSDLDFSVVSAELFNRLGVLFTEWASDYERGDLIPRNETERRYWQANLEFGRQNLSKGFMDANKIPTFDRYPLAQLIGQALWQLTKRLEQTEDAPTVKRASIRVYEGWESLIRRVSFNLYIALNK